MVPESQSDIFPNTEPVQPASSEIGLFINETPIILRPTTAENKIYLNFLFFKTNTLVFIGYYINTFMSNKCKNV